MEFLKTNSETNEWQSRWQSRWQWRWQWLSHGKITKDHMTHPENLSMEAVPCLPVRIFHIPNWTYTQLNIKSDKAMRYPRFAVKIGTLSSQPETIIRSPSKLANWGWSTNTQIEMVHEHGDSKNGPQTCRLRWSTNMQALRMVNKHTDWDSPRTCRLLMLRFERLNSSLSTPKTIIEGEDVGPTSPPCNSSSFALSRPGESILNKFALTKRFRELRLKSLFPSMNEQSQLTIVKYKLNYCLFGSPVTIDVSAVVLIS